MPLRKSGTLAKATIVAATIGFAAVPASANAGLLSSLLKPKASTTTTTTTAAGTATIANPTATSTSTTTSSAVPAGTGCTPLATTKAFSGVDGDTADYSLAPNGGFESGATGWTLSGGARVVSTNETLGISAGKKALQLPLSSSATSPAFCVDESNPHFRFAYRVDNAALSGFIAYVIYRNSAGAITNVELVSSKLLTLAPSMWSASPKSPLATLIPLNATSKTASVQLKLTALNPTDFVKDTTDAVIGENALTGAATAIGGAASGMVGSITGALSPATNIGVTIDSVMVDPYRRG